MPWFRVLLVIVGIVTLAAAVFVLASCRSNPVTSNRTDEGLFFPTIAGRNLLEEDVQFPDDVRGSPTLVLIAFKQRQQLNVNTWLDEEASLREAIPGVRIIETPTISSGTWGWFAGYIDGAMRSGIPDPEARARTVTFYTNVREFRESLGLATDETIYAVLLDRDARVVSIQEGDFDPAKVARMTASLAPQPG